MTSLTSCIQKAGDLLQAKDKAAILRLAREHRTGGMSALEAGRTALAEHQADVAAQLDEMQASYAETTQKPATDPLADTAILRSVERASKLWREYATGDDGFKFGRDKDGMRSRNLRDVARAFSGNGVEIIESGTQQFDGDYQISADGDDESSTMVLHRTGGNQYRIDANRARPGDTVLAGNAGQRMYQALLAFAANNGWVVDSDQELSRVNQLRRTTALLSAALRQGSAEFIGDIHPMQDVRGFDSNNYEKAIGSLASAEERAVSQRIPEFRQMRIDKNGRISLDSNEELDRMGYQAGRREPSVSTADGDQSRGRGTPDNGRNSSTTGQDGARQAGSRLSDRTAQSDANERTGEPSPVLVEGTSRPVAPDSIVSDYLSSVGGGFKEHGVGLNTLKRALVTKAALAGDEVISGPGALFSKERVDRTDAPEFKKWFGDSKVVDADGKPLVVYHGTASDFSEFSPSARKLSQHPSNALGHFFTEDAAMASRYANSVQSTGQNVIASFVSIKSPLRFKSTESFYRTAEKQTDVAGWRENLQAQGYDGIIVGNMQEVVAFDPTQIKSAIGNNGDFDVNSPDITRSVDRPVFYSQLESALKSVPDRLATMTAPQWKLWLDANAGKLGVSKDEVAMSGVKEYLATRGKEKVSREDLADHIESNLSDGTPVLSATRSMSDIKLAGGYVLGDLMKTSKKVTWWDKTVGTPFHMAEKHPEFKRTYDALQNFIGDVSRFATRAADMAPTILPKLENMADIAKRPLSAQDTEALSDPVFQGTLVYHRDAEGNPVRTDDVGLAGLVWTREELRDMWNLNPKQIDLYREFRNSVNKSLNDLGITDMVRYAGKDGLAVRDQMLEAGTAKRASEILADHLSTLAAADPERGDLLTNTAAAIKEKAGMVQGLVAKGYAPLSRFGDYTVYVTKNDGAEQVYFGMFETEREANKMARAMRIDYPDGNVTTGTMSKESYKLFSGVTPETLALFGEALGLEESSNSQQSQVFQTYIQAAKTSRSAMKRLITRKGINGYSEDVGRVLAGFVYSNGRQSSTNIHAGELTKSAADIKEGDLKDAALRLLEYGQNPAQEAQAFRGLLFVTFIGGSIASAFTNLTQSATTTWPTLSQHFGVSKASSAMADALKIATKGAGSDTDLAAALKRAEENGVTAPQEVHQLLAQSAGRGSLSSGDGTAAGDALAHASNAKNKLMLVWGKAFGWAEQMNRKIAFAAAYKLARERGDADAYGFAAKVVAVTQFTANKGNVSPWARGPVGATLFTFRKFTFQFLEGLARMWGSGPEGKKAFALSLAVMFLLAGTNGFPFADDLDDLIDGFMQRVLNKSFSSKLAKKEFFAGIIGSAGAEFVEGGFSSLPGVPIDVSGRLGMGNVIPMTGLAVKKQDHSRDVAELGGAAGAFLTNLITAAGSLAQGNIRGAVTTAAPTAVANVLKGLEMAQRGAYVDSKGKKVIETTTSEAILKAVGFQPSSVKQIQDATGIQQTLIGLNKIRESEIADLWTRGRVNRDDDLIADAKKQLADWNAENPGSRIAINGSQISARVKEANMEKAKRVEKSAPKEIRKSVKAELDAYRS